MSFMAIFTHRAFSFRPHKPRNPLLRAACALLGIALLALLLVFGLFIGLAMLLFAATRRMLRKPIDPQARVDGVIDGEYSVVSKPRASFGLR